MESKEKGAPVRVRWSQIVIRRPVFTPPLRSSTGHSLRRRNRENRWFYPTFFRRLRRWGSVRGAAPRYSLFTLPYSLFLFFAGRGFPDAPRTTLLFSVILRPQAEESASPVPGRHKIGRGKRILRFAQDDGGWSATTPARQAAYQAHPHPSGRWPATFPLGGGRSEKTPSAKPSPHRGEGAPQGRMRGRWTGASPQITRTLQRSGKI